MGERSLPASEMFEVSARVVVADPIGPIDRRIFGAFVEHMGRCVYGGIYEPGHPDADEDGFRRDVLELVRELGVTVVRYPGGNFVSGYRWEDGVGPVAERPKRLDLAWHTLETNEFGLDEFMRWTRKAGVAPLLVLNLGTRGVSEALDLLEYANHPAGTALSDRRVGNGAVEPYGIRMWCLGNEMDGPWQLGHKTASEYARLATETARAMRQFDPDLELIVCGSSGFEMPTFGAWEQSVLAEASPLVDFLSLHAYYEELDDLGSFLASSVELDRQIRAVEAIVDQTRDAQGSSRMVRLALDEYNVWYQRRLGVPARWQPAPRVSEDAYTVADAVVLGSLLITLLQHADRIACACLAQLVNTIAPIHAEPGGAAFRKTTFYPFSQAATTAGGVALPVVVTGESVSTARYGEVRGVDAVAALDEEARRLSVFAVNRDPSRSAKVELDLIGVEGASLDRSSVVWDADPHARNTVDDPLRVTPRTLGVRQASPTRASFELPPVSWATISFAIARTP